MDSYLQCVTRTCPPPRPQCAMPGAARRGPVRRGLARPAAPSRLPVPPRCPAVPGYRAGRAPAHRRRRGHALEERQRRRRPLQRARGGVGGERGGLWSAPSAASFHRRTAQAAAGGVARPLRGRAASSPRAASREARPRPGAGCAVAGRVTLRWSEALLRNVSRERVGRALVCSRISPRSTKAHPQRD